jgi:uncharacterized protein (TIGR02271 family)
MSSPIRRSTVVGVFEDRADAQKAINELKRQGFREDQIGMVASDPTQREDAAEEKGTTETGHAGTGAIAGAATGAGVGGLWALGIAAGMLPAIGPVIAGGILASVLASAVAGAAVGGIAGALIGLGIPEEEAEYYQGEVKSGRTLVTVKSDGRFDEAMSILRQFGAYDIHDRERADQPLREREMAGGARRGMASDTGRTIQAREEELHARKESVQTGEAVIRKDVTTEHRTLDVPVSKEEVVIERHPATGHEVSASGMKEGEVIRVPVREEEVHVEKQPVVKEEVTVGKRKTKDTERVSGTVRKEDIKVEKKGDVDIREEPRK